jgi:hypothetical protein
MRGISAEILSGMFAEWLSKSGLGADTGEDNTEQNTTIWYYFYWIWSTIYEQSDEF